MSHADGFQCNVLEIDQDLRILEGAGSLLFLLLSFWVQSGDSVFTSAGISPTFTSFIPLSPFETLLLGMVLLQIFILQLYGIVPFDLNKILHGDFSGMGFTKTGRKRRAPSDDVFGKNSSTSSKLELADKILSLILLTDHYDCVPRTLCEVQKRSGLSYKPPALFHALFFSFKFSLEQRQKGSEHFGPTSKPFEEAVELGLLSSHRGLNSTHCEVKYSTCPLSIDDIMTYVIDIDMQDFN